MMMNNSGVTALMMDNSVPIVRTVMTKNSGYTWKAGLSSKIAPEPGSMKQENVITLSMTRPTTNPPF
ncbi:hypothetical protein [Bacillus sp. mrc49]|uniref:hypothetical protein n=1 Tax=Bacillus sp. mrc49 TaxID=2054913 RepID=UPI000C2755B8|nr:hypothetical protein [Bacillus sp. mrc49]